MDILLITITVVSLLISLFLGIAAWGMWREERARSAARVAALVAATAEEEPAAQAPLATGHASSARPAPWNPPSDWRRPPRPAASPADHPLERANTPANAARHDSGMRGTFLGSAIATPVTGERQRPLALAAVALFVALAAGAFFTFGDERQSTRDTVNAEGAGSPLELMSLRHERDGGGLAISGLIRNPRDGGRVEKLSAVALLFDQQGELVTSSRADVDFAQLAPGDESPFVVRLNAPAHVARYRVSFRTDAGVVPHIDRRGQDPIARDVP